MTGECLARLRALGSFSGTRYPAVVAGSVAGDAATVIREAYRTRLELFAAVERIVPVEESVAFERDDVTERLCEALEGAGSRLAGRSFYVRARLRGLKGRVEHQAVERALGAFLLERAEAAGQAARVRFADTDVVVAVEVLGSTVGYAYLDRELRAIDLVRAP